MRSALIRRILSGDRAWALYQLRGQPVELWQDVLTTELARKRPRKRLVATLRERIPQLAIRSWMPQNEGMEETAKRGAPEGNQNAAKEEDGLDAVLHLRVRADEKAAWNKQARKAGKKLAKWVRERLNSEH